MGKSSSVQEAHYNTEFLVRRSALLLLPVSVSPISNPGVFVRGLCVLGDDVRGTCLSVGVCPTLIPMHHCE